MTHDPKLAEAVRLAAERIFDCLVESSEAEELLAAIDAAVDEHGNRIAWVAPSELTPALARRGSAMVLDTQMASAHPERGGNYNDFELPMAVAWRSVRHACLAGRRGEER